MIDWKLTIELINYTIRIWLLNVYIVVRKSLPQSFITLSKDKLLKKMFEKKIYCSSINIQIFNSYICYRMIQVIVGLCDNYSKYIKAITFFIYNNSLSKLNGQVFTMILSKKNITWSFSCQKAFVMGCFVMFQIFNNNLEVFKMQVHFMYRYFVHYASLIVNSGIF